MYKGITVDRSILYIEQEHVDKFIDLAEKHEAFNHHLKEGGVSKKDAWIIAFNIWLLLLPDECNIIQTAEKTIYYSSNFLILNAIKDNVHFKNLKRRKERPESLYYLTALTITSGLNEWYAYVMEKYELDDIFERNQDRIYFDSHKGTKKEVQQFLEDQARFVKVAVKELNSTDSFNDMIKKACDEAFFIYKDYFVKNRVGGSD